MLSVKDKSTHGEKLFQPLQTNNKQIEIAVTFLTLYNRLFNVTNENKNSYFTKPIKNENDIIISIPTGT